MCVFFTVVWVTIHLAKSLRKFLGRLSHWTRKSLNSKKSSPKIHNKMLHRFTFNQLILRPPQGPSVLTHFILNQFCFAVSSSHFDHFGFHNYRRFLDRKTKTVRLCGEAIYTSQHVKRTVAWKHDHLPRLTETTLPETKSLLLKIDKLIVGRLPFLLGRQLHRCELWVSGIRNNCRFKQLDFSR